MTVTQMAEELEFIKKQNEEYRTKMNDPSISKEIRGEYRARLLENNHQRMHLESTLSAIKYDPLF